MITKDDGKDTPNTIFISNQNTKQKETEAR